MSYKAFLNLRVAGIFLMMLFGFILQNRAQELQQTDYNLGKSFEIRFEIFLQSNKAKQFGNIVHISNNQNSSIDLIYDGIANPSLKLLSKDQFTSISVPVSSFEKKWNTIHLRIDAEKNQLYFVTSDSVYFEQNLDFDTSGKYKIIWGDNLIYASQSSSRPLQIRNVQIFDSKFNQLFKKPVTNSGNRKKALWWLILIIGFDVLVLTIYSIRKWKQRKTRLKETIAESSVNSFDNTPVYSNVRTSDAIYIFGSFRLYNSDGLDLSNKLSPLQKELFLILLFYGTNSQYGIPSNQLVSTFWPDMSDKNARNNLAANIGKLKSTLSPLGNQLIINTSGSWKIDTDILNNYFYCDYLDFLSTVQDDNQLSIDKLNNLLDISEKGGLLQHYNFEWLDAFKARTTNIIIDQLLGYYEKYKQHIDQNLALRMADVIFIYDMVNENAMEIKCKALIALGKHSLAKESYLKFAREYQRLYDKSFERSFKSIME